MPAVALLATSPGASSSLHRGSRAEKRRENPHPVNQAVSSAKIAEKPGWAGIGTGILSWSLTQTHCTACLALAERGDDAYSASTGLGSRQWLPAAIIVRNKVVL